MNAMKKLFSQLKQDETGMVISSELVLIATFCILPLVVGLSEVSCAINQELSEMSETFCTSNQISIGRSRADNEPSNNRQCDIYCN